MFLVVLGKKGQTAHLPGRDIVAWERECVLRMLHR
jgi:hypothetical protein